MPNFTKHSPEEKEVLDAIQADAYQHADNDAKALLKAEKTALNSIYHAVKEYPDHTDVWIEKYVERMSATLGWAKGTAAVRKSNFRSIVKGRENAPELWEEWMQAAIRGDVGHGFHATVAMFTPKKAKSDKPATPIAAEGLSANKAEEKAPTKVKTSSHAKDIILENLDLLSDQGAVDVLNSLLNLMLSRESLQELALRLEEAYNEEAEEEELQKAA